jgi:hypothetical protein
MAIMSSPKRLARVAGLFYIGLSVFMALSWFGVRDNVVVPGDAAATTAEIAANATLFRLGFVSELVGITFFVFLGMALYMLLKHVNSYVAAAMMVFVALGTAIHTLNMLNYFAALMLATEGSYATAIDGGGTDVLVLMFMDLHDHGYNIAQVYFSLWLLPLGYLAYKSGWFPRALGVLLMIGAATHTIEVLTHFLFPDVSEAVIFLVQIPAIIAELWMMGYLLIRGVRVAHPDERIPDTAAA